MIQFGTDFNFKPGELAKDFTASCYADI